MTLLMDDYERKREAQEMVDMLMMSSVEVPGNYFADWSSQSSGFFWHFDRWVVSHDYGHDGVDAVGTLDCSTATWWIVLKCKQIPMLEMLLTLVTGWWWMPVIIAPRPTFDHSKLKSQLTLPSSCVGLESRMAAVAIKQGSTIRHIDLSRKQQQQ